MKMLVVYKKPFWDKVFGRMPPKYRSLFTEHISTANVGISYSDKEQLEIFEKFNNPEVLAALWQVGEIDETETSSLLTLKGKFFVIFYGRL